MFEYNHGSNWSNSDYKSFYHIHARPAVPGSKKLVKTGSVQDCREFFVRSYRKVINKNDGFTPFARKAFALVTFGNPRSGLKESWQAQLTDVGQKGVYIINSFEKAHGWPLTKVYPVKSNIPMIFYAGPRKWTTSPYLMSIWTLCLRIGRNTWIPSNLFELKHNELVKRLYAEAGKPCQNDDAQQLRRTIREWDHFLTLYKDLFGGKPRKYHWSLSHLNGRNDRPEGIRKLIEGSTGYQSLYKKYYKLKEAKGLK